jgi:hypothetical protein
VNETTNPAQADREPVLSVVDRVSEMLFGLFMAIAVTGAVSVADQGNGQIRTMFIAALGCNLAWGLVDAVMYLVSTISDRGRLLSLIHAVRAEPDPKAGCGLIERALSKVAAGLFTEKEIEAVRGRIMALTDVPEAPRLNRGDTRAALAIFLIVVASTFPVVLPYMVFADVWVAKTVSRAVALVMMFGGGLALGHYAGFGSWRVGFAMVLLGSGLVVAIEALGG